MPSPSGSRLTRARPVDKAALQAALELYERSQISQRNGTTRCKCTCQSRAGLGAAADAMWKRAGFVFLRYGTRSADLI